MKIPVAPGQRDRVHAAGHPTQEYLVYGDEWFLYVCNRLAEDPRRLFTALLDAVDGAAGAAIG